MIGMMSVIIAAILLIIVGYSAVGFSGYLAFPRTVSSNALNNFSDRDVLMQASSETLNHSEGIATILIQLYLETLLDTI